MPRDQRTWFEREEDDLAERYNRGDIDQSQFNREMRELRDTMRDEHERAREDAIERFEDGYGW